MQKDKFENIVVTERHVDTFVPFKSILNITKSSLPKDSEIYYMILSKCFGKDFYNSNDTFILSILILVMLNYREKYGKDPLPSERGSEDFAAEAAEIIKKYDLEDKINHLVEYVLEKLLYYLKSLRLIY